MPKCALEKRRPAGGVMPGRPGRPPAPTARISSTRITEHDVEVNGLKLVGEHIENTSQHRQGLSEKGSSSSGNKSKK